MDIRVQERIFYQMDDSDNQSDSDENHMFMMRCEIEEAWSVL